MKHLLNAAAASLLLFSLSACAVGFGEQFPPEPASVPPYAYSYPYPPEAYIAPPPVALGFGFRFGGHGGRFERGGHFAHAGHSGGHGGSHHS